MALCRREMCGPSEDPVKRLAIDRTSERVEVADKLLQLEEMAVLDELALSLPVPGPCPSSLDGSFDTNCAHAGVCCWQSAKTLGGRRAWGRLMRMRLHVSPRTDTPIACRSRPTGWPTVGRMRKSLMRGLRSCPSSLLPFTQLPEYLP